MRAQKSRGGVGEGEIECGDRESCESGSEEGGLRRSSVPEVKAKEDKEKRKGVLVRRKKGRVGERKEREE